MTLPRSAAKLASASDCGPVIRICITWRHVITGSPSLAQFLAGQEWAARTGQIDGSGEDSRTAFPATLALASRAAPFLFQMVAQCEP